MRPLVLAAAVVMMPAPGLAHAPSRAQLELEVSSGGIDGRWDIALRDLAQVLELDADASGSVTWRELRARRAEVEAHALARLEVSGCTLAPSGLFAVGDHVDGAHAVIGLTGRCAPPLASLEVEYRLLFDVDPLHRALLQVRGPQGTSVHVLSSERRTVVLPLGGGAEGRGPEGTTFARFVLEGIEHIAIGYDHVLFLLTLLLPSVLRREGDRWRGVETLGPAARDVLRVVTAFTVAHSLTLGLSAAEVVRLPSVLVESVIASSVALAALDNLWPFTGGKRWPMAFGLGLVHGFGFSAVLAELGLPAGQLVTALLGFNLGVEVGQLAIVAAFLPVAFALRTTRLYRVGVVRIGSAVILVIALAWLAERAA